MKKAIMDLLVSAGELHPQGDVYVGQRLPEFRFDCQDQFWRNRITQGTSLTMLGRSSGPGRANDPSIHPMRVMGRYMICAVHNDAVANSLQVTGSAALCQELVQQWHDEFVAGGFFKEFDQSGRVDFSSAFEDKVLEDIFLAVIATMTKVARPRLSRAKPYRALFILSEYPELAEGWLQAGKSRNEVAVLCDSMVRVSNTPEVIDRKIEACVVSEQDLARAGLSESDSLELGVG